MNTKLALVIAAASLAMPFVAHAQSADSKYCSALSDKVEQYQNTVGKRGQENPPVAVSTAESKCSSDPASAIPVLEKALKDAKIDLPPRG